MLTNKQLEMLTMLLDVSFACFKTDKPFKSDAVNGVLLKNGKGENFFFEVSWCDQQKTDSGEYLVVCNLNNNQVATINRNEQYNYELDPITIDLDKSVTGKLLLNEHKQIINQPKLAFHVVRGVCSIDLEVS
ncbi:hypothetical protein LRP52_29285 [Photobacterium sp. ZSDE20]|uniref:Uncharacterized protein n=1 Tax=Photobacterium pectinilyticum TaxID=2906793 RepID=A0ABT1N6W5_9GAMM|nr:hypothetical protein [Photobacterium sp. ZSDE20]MCQ1060287.1 hypothetical protein [Photobacterium sp. ZSDE20]MDD1826274.1 hypothetical protein [Photobacterium sp. ZSDE20]